MNQQGREEIRSDGEEAAFTPPNEEQPETEPQLQPQPQPQRQPHRLPQSEPAAAAAPESEPEEIADLHYEPFEGLIPPMSLVQSFNRILQRSEDRRRAEAYAQDPRRIPKREQLEQEQQAMDKFLNTKLMRDHLPPDTPLPTYLSYREPRCVSPPSMWDKKLLKKRNKKPNQPDQPN